MDFWSLIQPYIVDLPAIVYLVEYVVVKTIFNDTCYFPKFRYGMLLKTNSKKMIYDPLPTLQPTSVTVVLWKVSSLYAHPRPHGPRSVRLFGSRTSEDKHEVSERLKFGLSVAGKKDRFSVAELELSRQR